jgi:hypothetical protein
MEVGVSDPRRRGLDASDHAPPGPREPGNGSDPISSGHAGDGRDWSAQRKPGESVAHLRPVENRDAQAQKQADIFAEALAKVMQEQLEPELIEALPVLQKRRSSGIAASLVVAAGVAALVALVFGDAFQGSQGPAEADALSTPPIWQSLKSSLLPTPQRQRVPTLVVRDGSGPVNEPRSLGVNVNSPGPGATVTIEGMPAGAKLTIGRRMQTGEWRVPAAEISDASIIPPADFVGGMNLTIALHGSDGAALVKGLIRLAWTTVTPDGAAGVSAGAATAPSDPPAPTPQPQQQQPPLPVASLAPSGATPAEPPMREINPGEVAGFLGRAQQLLAAGDLQAARLLLLRAAEAHDARAALALAMTFDPMVSKQLGATEPEPDLAKARYWYQKAREWGAPEAQRQLDALASYTR